MEKSSTLEPEVEETRFVQKQGYHIPSKKTIRLWYFVIVASTCMIFYGYDASVYNAVLGSANWTEYNKNPSDNAVGGINTLYTVGGIVTGFFVSGPVSDRFGRKIPMMIGCFLVIVATIMQVCQPRGVGVFLGGRLIIGIAQGFALPVAPVYLGEISTSGMRGKTITIFQTFYSIGSFICFWVNYACTKNSKTLGNWDWRVVIMFQLMAPIFILINLPFMIESPRWLMSKNQVDRARRSLTLVRNDPEEVEQELDSIYAAIEYEKNAQNGSYWPLWKDKSLRKRFLMCIVINSGQQLTGQGSLNSYSSKIYAEVFDNADTIQLINALNATFGILFTLNAIWCVDRFGRRMLLITGGAIMAIAMLIIAIVETHVKPTYTIGCVTAFLFFFYELGYKPSWGAMVWCVTSEVFPLNVRANAVGAASQFQNVANAIVNQFFPTFLSHKGFQAMYLFFAINTCLTIFVIFFVPETKGKTLEEIDTIFGGKNHVDEGHQIAKAEGEEHLRDHENKELYSYLEKPEAEFIEVSSTKLSLKSYGNDDDKV